MRKANPVKLKVHLVMLERPGKLKSGRVHTWVFYNATQKSDCGVDKQNSEDADKGEL